MAGYAKQRTNWQDFPVTSTPILAANLNAWEQTLFDLKTLTFNVKDYGAKGDGVTDDATAVAAAYSDVPSGTGGVVYWPPGVYIVSSLPSLAAKRNVITRGVNSGFDFGGYGTTII